MKILLLSPRPGIYRLHTQHIPSLWSLRFTALIKGFSFFSFLEVLWSLVKLEQLQTHKIGALERSKPP